MRFESSCGARAFWLSASLSLLLQGCGERPQPVGGEVDLRAVLGIWSSFAALQLDRQKEIAVLRALGAAPKHVRALVLGQTALLGFVAGMLSLPVGAFVGYVLATVVNRGSFGWSLLAFDLPMRLLVEALALALGASVLAGLWPAFRMARQAPAAALRED